MAETETKPVSWAIYALLANRGDGHDLRFLGQIEFREIKVAADETAFEREIDKLIEGLTGGLPVDPSGEIKPWDLLPSRFGDGGKDAYKVVLAIPVDAMEQVDEPGRRPFRMGWPHDRRSMRVRSIL